MKKLELTKEEIQQSLIKLLLEFQIICRKNNLKFYLSGGTLLGAIRHKGFIPWDDDIDISMPRGDYEKLCHLLKDNSSLVYQDNGLPLPYAKYVNRNIFIDMKYQDSEASKYLWIDIFPLDGFPESEKDTLAILNKMKLFRRLYAFIYANKDQGRTFIRKTLKKYIIPIFNFLFKKHILKQFYKDCTKYPYTISKYVGAVSWGLYGIGEKVIKSELEKEVLVEFESHIFPTYGCWDTYLRGLYNNYMELPPIEKRVNHSFTAWTIENES